MKCVALLFLLINLVQNTNPQDSPKDSLLNSKIKKRISPFLKENPNLLKASTFYFKKNWDSTLVHTNVLLNSPSISSYIKEYAHFFRGQSFQNKAMPLKAKAQFLQISKTFEFHPIVQMDLGKIALDDKERKYEEARSIFKKLLERSDKEELFIEKRKILNNLGVSYMHLEKYAEAERYLKESIKNETDQLVLVDGYTNLGNAYFCQYIDDKAMSYFSKAYDLVKTDSLFFDLYKQKRIVAFNMSEIEKSRKNYKEALRYLEESQRWKDSLYNQNKIYEIAQREKEFAVQQKQNEIDILEVKNTLQATQKKMFLYTTLALCIFLGIGLYFYREKVKTNQIIRAQKTTLDTLNTTKDKLFSIVSHDLRSSVNALKFSNKTLIQHLESKNMSALENVLQQNSTIVNGAYGLLDNLLNWALLQTEQQYFYVEKLFLHVVTAHVAYNYKALMSEKQVRFENTVSKTAFAYADQESLKAILRNLLDNAIKFSNPKGTIRVYTIDSSENYCDLIVEDTGLGMSEATRLTLLEENMLLNKKEHEDVIGTGLGIQLCKSMIKKSNGKFNIESEVEKGTKMIVSLPKTPPR